MRKYGYDTEKMEKDLEIEDKIFMFMFFAGILVSIIGWPLYIISLNCGWTENLSTTMFVVSICGTGSFLASLYGEIRLSWYRK